MKKIKKIMKKISPAIVGCLTLVLTINANTASCFILNEPKQPKGIDEFTIMK